MEISRAFFVIGKRTIQGPYIGEANGEPPFGSGAIEAAQKIATVEGWAGIVSGWSLTVGEESKIPEGARVVPSNISS